MYPDWSKVVEEFVKPVSMLYIMIIAMLFVAIGYHFWKDRVKIEKKLGTRVTKWLLEEEE